MSRKYSIFITALFCLFVFGFGAALLILPDREFSEQENRYLTQFPSPTLDSVKSGAFMSDFEEYVNDQFPLRDGWIALKAWAERLSGKQENNGVYFGGQDTLINRVDTPAWSVLEGQLGYVDALVGNTAVPVYLGIIPTSAAVWAGRLPAGAPTADELSLIDRMYFATGAATIDMAGALLDHSGEDIYYRTDHHWTSLGAYYGANAILQAMGLEALDIGDYQKTTVTDEFYGTTFSTSGVRWVKPDCIDIYVPQEGVEVTSWFGTQPSQGSLYVDSWLAEKDKYSFFLGGRQQPLCVVENPAVDGPRLLVIRDSYSDSLAPFLSQRFSQVHLFDPRTNKTSVMDYVEDNGIDMVLVLYSFSNFATDRNLFVLSR